MGWLLYNLLTGIVEPFLWFKSMSTLGCKKSRGKCYVAVTGYYSLILVKCFVETYIRIQLINISISMMLLIYIVFTTIFIFQGSISEKITNISIFFSLLLGAELMVLSFTLFYTHGDLSAINQSWVICICSITAKIIEVLGCYFIFIRRKGRTLFGDNIAKISLLIVVVSMLGNVFLKYVKDKISASAILTFELTQTILLWYILKTSSVLKKKDERLFELEKEVSSNEERQKLLENLAEFRHDYSVHSTIIKNMLYCKEYDKATEYAELIYKDVEKTKLSYTHSNIAITILINQLQQKAQKYGIILSAVIQVDDFGMKDNDICSILHNIVMNALEAAAKLPKKNGIVTLLVIYTETGYEISCFNHCVGIASFENTTKKDKMLHGFGVGIVEKLIKKYNGTMKMKCKEISCKGVGLVTVSIYLSCAKRKVLY